MSDPALFAPAGALTMQSAPALLAEGQQRARAGDLVVDLAAVSAADSAALALILDWMRCARAAGHTLVLRNPPAGLSSLAALYDIDALLPLERAA
ncbi:MAG: STAS domain-containing protein [Thauera sp.]|nr:STAS domain-containing protein [Thauera sp.]